MGRASDLVRRLDALLRDARHAEAAVEWSLEPLRSPWSEHHHAPAREPRKPVELQPLGERPSDPLYEIRKQLRLQYIMRIAPGPEEVRRFAKELKRFNEDMQTRAAALQARFTNLSTTWQDQEHEKFAEEFVATMKVLRKFMEISEKHTPFLLRKAQRIEEYLDQR